MQTPPPTEPRDGISAAVSPENPCPFLRALVAGGFIDPHAEPISRVAELIAEASGAAPAEKLKVRAASLAIASIANGLGPRAVLHNLASGLSADTLRGGPLDKKGTGSRILNQHAEVTPAELDRLDQFAADFERPDGAGTERGLGLAQLRTMMDDNFARAAGTRRRIDRWMMDGEWPVLLRVMGRGEGAAAYLSLAELRVLFEQRKLPARITQRITRFLRSNPG
jgi:hypothetical protein